MRTKYITKPSGGRSSIGAIAILNFCITILSIFILGAGIWLASKHHTDCMRFLQWPIIVIGLFMFLVSLAGLIGACCRSTALLCVYTTVMFILIVLLLCFTTFAFAVTNKGAGDAVSGRGYMEFRLGRYSDWLQKEVNKSSVWRKIKSCLLDANECSGLDSEYTTVDQFDAAQLSPIQSGCCKPPSSCGYTFVSATNWTSPTNPTADSDCSTWSNDPKELCYNCNSCKAGVLQNVKKDWRKVAIVNIIVLVLVIFLYAISVNALRSVRGDLERENGYF